MYMYVACAYIICIYIIHFVLQMYVNKIKFRQQIKYNIIFFHHNVLD